MKRKETEHFTLTNDGYNCKIYRKYDNGALELMREFTDTLENGVIVLNELEITFTKRISESLESMHHINYELHNRNMLLKKRIEELENIMAENESLELENKSLKMRIDELETELQQYKTFFSDKKAQLDRIESMISKMVM